MTKTIFGHKIGMTELYQGNARVGVTEISLLPMTVTQVKTVEKDGYSALQVAFGPKKARHEIAFAEDVSVGATINPADVVSVGSLCTLRATSKGKGYAGVVKRWNFAGGPRTHGQSDRLRAPGSIGQGTTPGRVHKGKHMAGRMGSDTVTRKNVAIIKHDVEHNRVWVAGPVPGSRNSLVRLEITQAGTQAV